jgi:hypothetical protein
MSGIGETKSVDLIIDPMSKKFIGKAIVDFNNEDLTLKALKCKIFIEY